MATTVNMHEAKTRLSQLVAKAEAGEEVIISRAGKPVAKLTAMAPRKRAKFGFAKGSAQIVGDINDPLPDKLLEAFYSPLLPGNGPEVSSGARKSPKRQRRKAARSK